MTLVLLRLKLALVRNMVGAKLPAWAQLVVAHGIPLVLGIGSFLLLALARGATFGVARGITLAVSACLFLGWLIGPVITVGLDATIDPLRLVTFPLSRRQLTVGLFAASCLGGGGIYTALVAAGLVVASEVTGPAVVLAVAAGASLVGVCVVTARAVAAGVSAASRRVRDVLLFVIPLLLMVPALLPSVTVVGQGDNPEDLPDLSRLAGKAEAVALALPTGPGARSIVAAAAGEIGASLAWLAASAGWLLLLLVAWSFALTRSLERPLAVRAAGDRAQRHPATDALFPVYARWLPRDRVGAVAAKELRLTFRDPRQRVALIGSAFGSTAFVFSGLAQPSPNSVLRACAVSFFIAATATNMYGFDGASHWVNVAAGDDARADLTGKCVARGLIALVGGVATIIALALFTNGWSRAGYAMALCVCALGLGLGASVWVSVVYPSPAPANQRNVFAGSNTGQGFQVIGPVLLITLVGIGVLGSLSWAMTAGSPAVRLASVLLALVLGPLAFLAGMGRAVARTRDRQPELLLALTKAA